MNVCYCNIGVKFWDICIINIYNRPLGYCKYDKIAIF